jgi:hypothetical protein
MRKNPPFDKACPELCFGRQGGLEKSLCSWCFERQKTAKGAEFENIFYRKERKEQGPLQH